jgi:hypothetical protein
MGTTNYTWDHIRGTNGSDRASTAVGTDCLNSKDNFPFVQKQRGCAAQIACVHRVCRRTQALTTLVGLHMEKTLHEETCMRTQRGQRLRDVRRGNIGPTLAQVHRLARTDQRLPMSVLLPRQLGN